MFGRYCKDREVGWRKGDGSGLICNPRLKGELSYD